MSILRKLKVWHIKRKAREAYLTWHEFGSDLDCGSHMAAVLRPTHKQLADFAAMQFNRYMDQLATLGEKVPAKRLGDNVSTSEPNNEKERKSLNENEAYPR